MRKILLLGLILPLLVSCMKDDDYVDYGPIDEKIISEYLQEKGIDAIRDSSGLYYKIITPGTGESIGVDKTKEENITFSYKAYLTNGKVFTDTEGENVTSNLWSLLYGLQIGLPKINRLGEIHLYIPSGLAYGASSGQNLPANSVVILEVKVNRDQADIDEDIIAAYLKEKNITDAIRDTSGLYYKIIEEGEGEKFPQSTSSIDVSYTGTFLDEKEFDSGTLTQQPLSKLIQAWQIGIPKLKKGGKAILYCPSQLAYGSKVKYNEEGKISIPANSILVFNLHLVKFR